MIQHSNIVISIVFFLLLYVCFTKVQYCTVVDYSGGQTSLH